MPRKVCHILGSSGRDGSGIANIVAALHRHTDQVRCQISACFVGADGPLVSRFQALKIPTSLIPWRHPSRDPSGAFALLRHLRRERYDVVHFHWGGPTLRRVTRLATSAKTVLHLHSRIEEGALHHKISTAGADAVIAVSNYVAAVSSHPRTRVIYSGVDFPQHSARSSDKNIIGFAGRLEDIKGVAYLVEAVSQLRDEFPDLQLRIAGEGSALSQLNQQAAALKLENNIAFLDWIDFLPAERASWTLMVQPSLEEGLGLTIIEAMAEGLPVIASNVGGISELINDHQTGILVSRADAKALANAIKELLRDAALRQRMGASAASRMKERFSAQTMAARVTAIYDELLTS